MIQVSLWLWWWRHASTGVCYYSVCNYNRSNWPYHDRDVATPLTVVSAAVPYYRQHACHAVEGVVRHLWRHTFDVAWCTPCKDRCSVIRFMYQLSHSLCDSTTTHTPTDRWLKTTWVYDRLMTNRQKILDTVVRWRCWWHNFYIDVALWLRDWDSGITGPMCRGMISTDIFQYNLTEIKR